MGNLGQNIQSQFSMYEDEVNKRSSSIIFFLFDLFQLWKTVGDLQEDL